MKRKQPANPDRLTTEQAAAFLGLSQSCLETWRSIQNEDGPPYLKLGRRVFYRQAALVAWLERCTVDRRNSLWNREREAA